MSVHCAHTAYECSLLTKLASVGPNMVHRHHHGSSQSQHMFAIFYTVSEMACLCSLAAPGAFLLKGGVISDPVLRYNNVFILFFITCIRSAAPETVLSLRNEL